MVRTAGACLAALLLVPGAAAAYFSYNDATNGNPAQAVADSLPQGATPAAPTTSPNLNSNTVSISFSQVSTSGGVPVPASNYRLKRYPAAGGSAAAVAAACSGTGTVTCTEANVPDGSWQYTDTPAYGQNWLGTESARSGNVLVDTAPPSDGLSLATGASGAFMNAAGSTIYYRGDTSGSFQLVDSVTDSGSGPASASFPAIATTGWTHDAETITSGVGSAPTTAYTSSRYSWSANPANPAGYAVSSKDNAGNSSSGVSPAFMSDTTPPTGGALTVNGASATASDPVSYSGSTTFLINRRTDYTEAQSTTQSGLASATLTIQSEALTNGSCGAPGSGGPFPTATTVNGTSQPSGITTGYCYLYRLSGKDNVGNAASISTTVAVDTSTPTTPALSFSGLSSNTYYSASLNTLYFRPAAGGAFTVAASGSTAPSGIAGYTFSSLSTNNFTGTPAGDQESYTFGASATQPSNAPTVSATSNSGNISNSASYRLVGDTAAPTGGIVTVNNVAATGAGSTSTTSSASFSINSRTDYAEGQSSSQSGLASSTLTIQSTTLSGTTCGAPGSGGPFTAPTTISGTTQPSGIAAGYCYLYTLTGTDNVGNAASISTTVQVSSAPPTTINETTAGTYTLSVPAGVTMFNFAFNGAGGGGGGNSGAAGAAGGSVSGTITIPQSTSATQFTVVVGGGGGGGANNTAGTAGSGGTDCATGGEGGTDPGSTQSGGGGGGATCLSLQGAPSGTIVVVGGGGGGGGGVAAGGGGVGGGGLASNPGTNTAGNGANDTSNVTGGGGGSAQTTGSFPFGLNLSGGAAGSGATSPSATAGGTCSSTTSCGPGGTGGAGGKGSFAGGGGGGGIASGGGGAGSASISGAGGGGGAGYTGGVQSATKNYTVSVTSGGGTGGGSAGGAGGIGSGAGGRGTDGSVSFTGVGLTIVAVPTINVTAPGTDATGTAIPQASISSFLSGVTTNATGTITFKVFGPSATAPTTCTTGGTTVGTATVSGNNTYHPSGGQPFAPSAAGTYWWYSTYSGDSNNPAVNTGCGAGMTMTTVN